METDLIADEGREQLIAAARTGLGDRLRSVTYFTHDSYEQVYLRDDLERDADLTSFVGHEWRGFETTQAVYGESELGTYQFTLRGFENGHLLRVTTENRGAFVTADGAAIRDYEEVATSLRSLLEEWGNRD
jgi:hypothetical protein